jgi:hypothetical protein
MSLSMTPVTAREDAPSKEKKNQFILDLSGGDSGLQWEKPRIQILQTAYHLKVDNHNASYELTRQSILLPSLITGNLDCALPFIRPSKVISILILMPLKHSIYHYCFRPTRAKIFVVQLKPQGWLQRRRPARSS